MCYFFPLLASIKGSKRPPLWPYKGVRQPIDANHAALTSCCIVRPRSATAFCFLLTFTEYRRRPVLSIIIIHQLRCFVLYIVLKLILFSYKCTTEIVRFQLNKSIDLLRLFFKINEHSKVASEFVVAVFYRYYCKNAIATTIYTIVFICLIYFVYFFSSLITYARKNGC